MGILIQKTTHMAEIANRVNYYASLCEAEARNFAGMGLCLTEGKEDWLSCRFCRNSRRKVLCVQGHDQVRAHFSDHRLGEAAVLEAAGSACCRHGTSFRRNDGGREKVTATGGPGNATVRGDRGTFGCLG